jgi:VWFA-related protein
MASLATRGGGLARVAALLSILVTNGALWAQETTSSQDAPTVLKSTSTFVLVPTRVRSSSGAPVRDLRAEQFRLFDEGVPQNVLKVKTDDLPISLVILMQTGGAAAQKFSNYADLPVLLGKILGGSEREIMFVTFDSRIEQVWHFPARSDGVFHALTRPHPGDGGRAIRDAVSFAVGQLQAEAGRFRRVVLLVSEEADEGSKIAPRDLLEQLGTGSTVVYSIVFPVRNVTKTHDIRSPGAAATSGTSNALARTLGRLSSNTAAEIASVTGGDFVGFSDQRSFNSGLIDIGAVIGDAYTLGFQPSQHTPGFHRLSVEVRAPRSTFNVLARSAYWFNPAAQDP